jgi:phosphatidylglycerol:prolipoprotein diacylglycerol transferase
VWGRVFLVGMVVCLRVAAVVLPGYFRVGRWHVPVFGLFAAAGVVGALWLSQRTAKLARLDADKLWDAGMMAVLVAFVASRVLLVAENWPAFVRFPVLVLAQPSLTYGGMVVTAALVVLYLRRKKIPVLGAMDAWAPCAAVFAAIWSLGHFVEGTDAGMPTGMPWGVRTPGDTVLGRVQPVQLYALLAALGMCELLLIRLKRRKRVGEVAAMALVAGGAIAFLLDMLGQPLETFGMAWLDPGQWIALGCVVVGVGVFAAMPVSQKRDMGHPNFVEQDVVKERV